MTIKDKIIDDEKMKAVQNEGRLAETPDKYQGCITNYEISMTSNSSQ